jgi:hypothetical protein
LPDSSQRKRNLCVVEFDEFPRQSASWSRWQRLPRVPLPVA